MYIELCFLIQCEFRYVLGVHICQPSYSVILTVQRTTSTPEYILRLEYHPPVTVSSGLCTPSRVVLKCQVAVTVCSIHTTVLVLRFFSTILQYYMHNSEKTKADVVALFSTVCHSTRISYHEFHCASEI